MAVVKRVAVNPAGVRLLLKDPRVTADLRRRARAIASAAGPGHEIRDDVTPTRVGVDVYTATTAARRSEARARTLSRAIDAGRR